MERRRREILINEIAERVTERLLEEGWAEDMIGKVKGTFKNARDMIKGAFAKKTDAVKGIFKDLSTRSENIPKDRETMNNLVSNLETIIDLGDRSKHDTKGDLQETLRSAVDGIDVFRYELPLTFDVVEMEKMFQDAETVQGGYEDFPEDVKAGDLNYLLRLKPSFMAWAKASEAVDNRKDVIEEEIYNIRNSAKATGEYKISEKFVKECIKYKKVLQRLWNAYVDACNVIDVTQRNLAR